MRKSIFFCCGCKNPKMQIISFFNKPRNSPTQQNKTFLDHPNIKQENKIYEQIILLFIISAKKR